MSSDANIEKGGAFVAALLLCGVLAVIFTDLMWFASLWTKHQDDHGVDEPKCAGKACTCAGTRHANDHLYRYACECCESAGCKPDPTMDLTPKKHHS